MKTRRAGRPAGAGQSQVQSLSRALSMLECLSQSDMGMQLSDLSEKMDLAPSTTHRLLNSMLHMGFVECDEQQGLWSVGVNAFTIGNAYLKKRNFAVQARPFMKELMNACGETCNLAVLEQNQVVFISQVECLETMRMVVRLGSRGPVHATGVGKALLSSMSKKDVEKIIKNVGMPELTGKTITTLAAFHDELSSIRDKGFAVDDEEQKEGLTCFAANIYDEYGEAIAAISISGPSVRIPRERFSEMSDNVMKTAAEITQAIGGKIS